MLNTLREELGWLLQHPIGATRWWFYRLVIARLNGDHAAAKRYEERMRMTSHQIEHAKRVLREMDFPPRRVTIERPPADPYDTAEFACPYDATPLTAPWQKCPKCGRND